MILTCKNSLFLKSASSTSAELPLNRKSLILRFQYYLTAFHKINCRFYQFFVSKQYLSSLTTHEEYEEFKDELNTIWLTTRKILC